MSGIFRRDMSFMRAVDTPATKLVQMVSDGSRSARLLATALESKATAKAYIGHLITARTKMITGIYNDLTIIFTAFAGSHLIPDETVAAMGGLAVTTPSVKAGLAELAVRIYNNIITEIEKGVSVNIENEVLQYLKKN